VDFIKDQEDAPEELIHYLDSVSNLPIDLPCYCCLENGGKSTIFTNMKQLTRHINEQHSDTRNHWFINSLVKYECADCSLRYCARKSLQNHYKKQHGSSNDRSEYSGDIVSYANQYKGKFKPHIQWETIVKESKDFLVLQKWWETKCEAHYGTEIDLIRNKTLNGLCTLQKNVNKIRGTVVRFFSVLDLLKVDFTFNLCEFHKLENVVAFIAFEQNRGLKSSTMLNTITFLRKIVSKTSFVDIANLSRPYATDETPAMITYFENAHKLFKSVATSQSVENNSSKLIESGESMETEEKVAFVSWLVGKLKIARTNFEGNDNDDCPYKKSSALQFRNFLMAMYIVMAGGLRRQVIGGIRIDDSNFVLSENKFHFTCRVEKVKRSFSRELPLCASLKPFTHTYINVIRPFICDGNASKSKTLWVTDDGATMSLDRFSQTIKKVVMQFHPLLQKVHPLAFRRLAITDMASKFDLESLSLGDFKKNYLEYLNTSDKMMHENYNRNCNLESNRATLQLVNQPFFNTNVLLTLEEESSQLSYADDIVIINRVKRTVDFIDDNDWNKHFHQYKDDLEAYKVYVASKNGTASPEKQSYSKHQRFSYVRCIVSPSMQVDIVGQFDNVQKQVPLMMMDKSDIHQAFISLHFKMKEMKNEIAKLQSQLNAPMQKKSATIALIDDSPDDDLESSPSVVPAPKEYKCPDCGKSARNAAALHQHRHNFHNEVARTCKHCKEVFRSVKACKAHMKKVH
jgi:DNA-directed RNA polymerase subunit M/transcription elongation factor TFIIS